MHRGASRSERSNQSRASLGWAWAVPILGALACGPTLIDDAGVETGTDPGTNSNPPGDADDAGETEDVDDEDGTGETVTGETDTPEVTDSEETSTLPEDLYQACEADSDCEPGAHCYTAPSYSFCTRGCDPDDWHRPCPEGSSGTATPDCSVRSQGRNQCVLRCPGFAGEQGPCPDGMCCQRTRNVIDLCVHLDSGTCDNG